MTAHQGYRVTPVTSGITSSPFEHLRKPYVYGGDEKDEPDGGKHSGPPPSSTKSPSARAARMAVFAAARAAGAGIAEAGRAAGVTLTTAKQYRRELEGHGGGNG